MNPTHILIRGTNWVGDTILTTPTVHAIRQLYPQSQITILVKPHLRDLWKENPDINEIIVHPDSLNIFSLFSLSRQLRNKKFDLAIIFPNSFSAALPIYLAGIPKRIGYATQHRNWLLTKAIPVTNEILQTHQVNYYLNLIRQPGEVTAKPELVLSLGKDEQAYAKQIFSNIKSTNDTLVIGINPGATYGSAKRWLPERFVELGKWLISDYSSRLVFFGSPQEREYVTQIAAQIPAPSSVLDLSGKLNLAQLAAAIAQCHLFITNDTGSMHIAAALKVPTVAIFGSTDPETTSPYGDFPNQLVRKPADCAPCLLRECPTDHRCMTAITVDDVLTAVDRILSKKE